MSTQILVRGYGHQSEKSHWGQKDTLLIIFIERELAQPLKKRNGSFWNPVYNQNQKIADMLTILYKYFG
jgi:hypothetical protein